MKRALVTGLCILAAVALRAQDSTNTPPRRYPLLTAEQQAELARQADDAWSQLSPEAKSRLLRLHKALTDMPQEDRHFIHERIERFLTMSPEERDRIKKNAERWRAMSPEERDQARKQFQQWRKDHPSELTPPPPPGTTSSEPSKPNNPTQETK